MQSVNSILLDAKLPADEFLPVAYKLKFGSDISESSDVKLIEVDGIILSKLNTLEEMQLKGDPEEFAVFCSKETSYEIKEAETSNTLLFVPSGLQIPRCDGSGSDFEVVGVDAKYLAHIYFELTNCAPKLNQVFKLLSASLYKGDVEEQNVADDSSFYSVEKIVERVQASYDEVIACLADLGAFQLRGKVRLLDFDFSCEIVLHIIQLCLENSWKWSSVPPQEISAQLSSLYWEPVLKHVISFYSTAKPKWNNCEDISLPDTVALDGVKICRLIGEMILRSGTKFRLSDFLDSWRQAVPQGLEPKLSDLEGLAIIENSSSSKSSHKASDLSSGTIWFVNRLALPELFERRLEALFAEKPNWSVEEFAPFFNDLHLDKASLSSLLAKHARSILQNGSRVYSKKQI